MKSASLREVAVWKNQGTYGNNCPYSPFSDLSNRNEEKDETHVVHGVDTKKNPITNDSKVHSHSQPTKKFDMRQKLISEDWELDCEVCGAKGINKVISSYKFISSSFLTGVNLG